ncbi:MAG: nucleotidyltransferase domain-containing protein [Ardenticatenaceae bacterium]|nr:nucleotidyltransferase domain-containing protein [Ardenticatenaceae bacterium]
MNNTPLPHDPWPALNPPYDGALRQAVQFILDRFDPDILGIVVSGSIIRGNPNATSDLDIYVLRDRPERQRLQRLFNGVPAEIFVNPPAQVWRYLAAEQAEGRPVTAHMLATGIAVLQRHPVVAQLQEKAEALLATRPGPSPQALTMARYTAATTYEDATDVASQDPATAAMLMSQAVCQMLDYYFLAHGQLRPRAKELLATLAGQDPEAGALASAYWQTGDFAQQMALAQQLADRILGVRGFFEWETEPETIPPDSG